MHRRVLAEVHTKQPCKVDISVVASLGGTARAGKSFQTLGPDERDAQRLSCLSARLSHWPLVRSECRGSHKAPRRKDKSRGMFKLSSAGLAEVPFVFTTLGPTRVRYACDEELRANY